MIISNAIAYNVAVFISTLFLLEFGTEKFVDHTVIVARRTGIPGKVIALLTAGADLTAPEGSDDEEHEPEDTNERDQRVDGSPEVMSDYLSVAASIAIIISTTVEVVKFLSPYVSAAKETPQVAAHIYSEVQSTQVVLIGLQILTKNLESVSIQHAAMIGVNQVVAVLTDGVLLYSELYQELQSLWSKDDVEKVPLTERLQWVWKESTFATLLSRLQSFKSSMTLVLMILQSDSGQAEKEHQEQLSNNVKALLDNNNALSRRLMNIEDALNAQTINSRRMSIVSLSASPSRNTSQQLNAESPATSIFTNTSLAISKFDFEDDLESLRVYRRAVRETMDFSFRSSIPLLMQWLEPKLKILTALGMQRYFDKIHFPVNDFFHIWSSLGEAVPLVCLARALDLSIGLDIDLNEELTEEFRKELVLWFAQYCHENIKIKTSDLITTTSLLSNITKNLPITGSSSNDWSSANAQVDASSTELRILLTEQRQLLQNLDEVLKIKDELEIYMQSAFQSFRKPQVYKFYSFSCWNETCAVRQPSINGLQHLNVSYSAYRLKLYHISPIDLLEPAYRFGLKTNV
ncbi:hypothetical protein KAF25_010938 [Fusarium avenaceum]|uniref:Uncharacterized protein n=1 Tax=Fusarium avenaceum TaxID=40199 RepID=A0A9P7GSH2_9HYPO|nr:hypothetical protein KAF25_010938 [Fusarium avenaceum]